MAVFPDRIILKNSTDSDTAIRTAIESGGTDEIQQGELVIGRGPGTVQLYAVDSNGDIQTISRSGGAEYLEDLLDASYNRSSFGTGFEVGEYRGTVFASAGFATTEPRTGTYALTSSGRGLGWNTGIELNRNKRYDFWSFYFRSEAAASSSLFSIPLGGNQPVYRSTSTGYTLWMNNTNVYVTASSTAGYSLSAGAAPNWTANTYHHVLVQVDYGVAKNRAVTPRWSIWLNGNILVNNQTNNTFTWAPIDAALDEYIQFPSNSDSTWANFRKSLDDYQQGQGDTPIVSMTAATIVPATIDAAIRAVGAQDGQALVWDGSARLWVPGASAGGDLDGLSDVTITAPSNGQVLTYNGSEWVNGAGGSVGSIDDLSDVDTTTVPPSVGQGLEWDGVNWVPADHVSSIVAGNGILVSQASGSVTISTASTGVAAGTVVQKTEVATASGGAATFVELGASGTLVSIASSLNAWIVLYPTAADRAADAARVFGDDPLPGSGVLAEFYVTAAGTVLASPGTTYFNNDTTPADALYVAVRDQAGAAVNADVTIKAYVHQNFAGVGTNRVSDSGIAAAGDLTLTGMGQSGQLCTVTSSLDAWITIYGSAADRAADSARLFAADPAPGSGVQAEFYIAAGSTVLATPGSVYFNNDTSPSEAIYLAVRNQVGAPVNSLITITAYAETSFTGVSGGTFGSG